MKDSNKQACSELFKTHEPKLRELCEYKLKSCPDEVDEVIAEVFLALCVQTEKEGLPRYPAAWIWAVTNNIINKKYRKHYKDNKMITPLSDDIYNLPYSPNPEVEMLNGLIADELMQELEEMLNEKDVRILDLAYHNKMKYKDIAKIYNTTEDAIKQHCYRISKKIKEKIREKFI